MAKRGMNALEGIHVLDLDLGAELGLADRTNRNIDVRAHIPFFKIAVGNPSVNKHFLKRVQIGDCLIGRGHIRLGNDFHKRSSAAIEVDSGGLRIVVDLRGILLEMDMVDADELLRPVSERNLNAAADA